MRSCRLFDCTQPGLSDEPPDGSLIGGNGFGRESAFDANPVQETRNERLEDRRNRLWWNEGAKGCHDTKRPLIISEVVSHSQLYTANQVLLVIRIFCSLLSTNSDLAFGQGIELMLDIDICLEVRGLI